MWVVAGVVTAAGSTRIVCRIIVVAEMMRLRRHVQRMLMMMMWRWHHVHGCGYMNGNNGTGWDLVRNHHLHGHSRDRTCNHHLPSRHEIGRYLHIDGHVAGRRLVSRCHHVRWKRVMLLLWIAPVVKVKLVRKGSRVIHITVLLLMLLLLLLRRRRRHTEIGRWTPMMLLQRKRLRILRLVRLR